MVNDSPKNVDPPLKYVSSKTFRCESPPRGRSPDVNKGLDECILLMSLLAPVELLLSFKTRLVGFGCNRKTCETSLS